MLVLWLFLCSSRTTNCQPFSKFFRTFSVTLRLAESYSASGVIGQPNIFDVVSNLLVRIEALEAANQNLTNEMKEINEKFDQVVNNNAQSEEISPVTAITPFATTESGKWILKIPMKIALKL